MLKIANVIEEGRFGGPQRWISSVTGRLKGFGFEPIVIFPDVDSKCFYEQLKGQRIKTRRISLHRLTGKKAHLIKFFFFFIPEVISLYILFKKEHVDIVHCNNSWQFKGVIAGKMARKRVVWHLHETWTPPFINIIFKFLAVNFCDAFITAGQKSQTYYLADEKLAKKPIMAIQSPVNTVIFDPEKAKKDPEMAQCQGLKIITVGNINPCKGIEYYIEMASILNRKHEKLNFFVVGAHLANQKKYLKSISRLVKNYGIKNLHFYGPSNDILSLLKAADIYVCASILEASPMSVWEAMSMSKPVVTTDVGDVARFIKNGQSGFVVSTRNADALAKKVSLLIEDVNLRKKFGQKARDIAVKYLDLDTCVKKQAEFYKKL